LRQLRYFQALAQELHFGRAAEKVNVSQPALSVQIKELEQNLNAHLVERHTREVIITPLGHEVLRRTQEILSNVANLEYAMRWHGGLSGHLSVGMIPTIAPYLLPAVLPVLKARNPTLKLQAREADTETILSELAAGILDAAVIALPSGREDLFFETALFEDRFLLAGSVKHSSYFGNRVKALRPNNLDPAQLLLLDEGHCLTDQALEACDFDNSTTLANLRASSLTTLCGLVSAGFGLTFLPEISIARETSANHNLDVSRFITPEPSRQIGIIRRRMTHDDGWFNDLADVFKQTGEQLLLNARQEFPE